MSIADKVHDLKSKSSHELSEESKKTEATLSKVLGNVVNLSMTGMDAFLKTEEGKKVLMQIAKHYLKKYWWAAAAIVAFDLIGIFATVKYSLSKR